MTFKTSKPWVWACGLLLSLSGVEVNANAQTYFHFLDDPYRDVADFEIWECKDERGGLGSLVLVATNAKVEENMHSDVFGYHKKGFIFDIGYGVRVLETDFFARRLAVFIDDKRVDESITDRIWRNRLLIGIDEFTITEQPNEVTNYKGSSQNLSDFDYPDYICTKLLQRELVPNRGLSDPIGDK